MGTTQSKLYRLAQSGSTREVNDFLNNHPNININYISGSQTVLIRAVLHNKSAIKPLLDAGADPNIRDTRTGYTALMHILRRFRFIKSHIRIVQMLLDAGADPNLQDNSGYTALMYVARYNEKAIKVLLDGGADPNLQNKIGLTAQMVADKYNKNAVQPLMNAIRRSSNGSDDSSSGYSLEIVFYKIDDK